MKGQAQKSGDWIDKYHKTALLLKDCKKSTSVRLASLTNVGAYKLPNEESLAAAFRNLRQNRQNTGARI